MSTHTRTHTAQGFPRPLGNFFLVVKTILNSSRDAKFSYILCEDFSFNNCLNLCRKSFLPYVKLPKGERLRGWKRGSQLRV